MLGPVVFAMIYNVVHAAYRFMKRKLETSYDLKCLVRVVLETFLRGLII